MTFKLIEMTEARWRKLVGAHLLPRARGRKILTAFSSSAKLTKKIGRKLPDHAVTPIHSARQYLGLTQLCARRH
jgi:hypothetical protein